MNDKPGLTTEGEERGLAMKVLWLPIQIMLI